MPENPNKLSQFWHELKRRKVVRVITVFAAAAFVILELTDIVAPSLGLPEWTLNLIIILLCVSFIIVVALSWVYDMTPEGIQKTKPFRYSTSEVKPGASVGWKISTFISILIIIAFVTFYVIGNVTKSHSISRLEKSIAVLPFENWSYAEEFSHLGNAIANEIITELYKINEFRVLSYTSTLHYGETKKTIPEIGEELGANYIIEGIVERQDNRVNIHVQVIRAKNEDHIWADEFDGEWEDIFKIQDDIALEVADALKAVLSQEENEKIEEILTENLEAYNYYLRGNDFYWRSYEEQDYSIALNMYQKAIDLDPGFALAYAMLAKSHLSIYWFHYDRSADRLSRSKEAIDAAFRISPDLLEGYIALGSYYYIGFLDYDKALEQLEIAREYMPNNAECIYMLANVYRRKGNWQKAREGYTQAFRSDPGSQRLAFNAAQTHFLLNEYEEALNLINLAMNLYPDFNRLYTQKAELYLKWEGDTRNARKTLDEASLIINPSLDPTFIEKVVLLDIYEGNYREAIDFLNTTNFEAVQLQYYYHPKSLFYAWIYDLMQDTMKAEKYYNLTRIALVEKISFDPDDSRLYSSLGICYAGLGQKEQAIQAGKKGFELLPVSKEAFRGVYRLGDLARIYVMVGESELALEHLDTLLSIPGILSIPLLQLDPIWKPLWNHPGFIELKEKYTDR